MSILIILKLTIVFILFFACKYSFAQENAGAQVGRAQEILRQEEALRQKIDQPERVFIEEVVLPPDCAIPQEELEQAIRNFTGHWHSSKEIQEFLNVLAASLQKAQNSADLPGVSYDLERNRLIVYFAK